MLSLVCLASDPSHSIVFFRLFTIIKGNNWFNKFDFIKFTASNFYISLEVNLEIPLKI